MTEMNVTAVSLSTCMTANTAMPLYQYDYGQILLIEGIDLPFAYQVHFSTSETGGTSVTQVTLGRRDLKVIKAILEMLLPRNSLTRSMQSLKT